MRQYMIESNNIKFANATKAKEVKPRNKELSFTFGMIKGEVKSNELYTFYYVSSLP